MTRRIGRLAMAITATAAAMQSHADLIISQYVETESGTTPKAIEVWNSGVSSVDFTSQNLQVAQGTNGAALAPIAATLVNTGSLAANEVLVIGTADVGTYLTNQGLASVRFISFGFSFNGDDALQLTLGGSPVDTFGTPGSDPGSGWTGNGVSTLNQNIELLTGITTGAAPTGWTDPSLRFQTVSTTPSGTGGLAGFGLAPGVPVPEPSTLALAGIGLTVTAAAWRRRRRC